MKDDQSGLARHSKDAQDANANRSGSGADQRRREQQSHSGREGAHKRDGEQLQELRDNLYHHTQPDLDQKGRQPQTVLAKTSRGALPLRFEYRPFRLCA